jgi:4-hydroxy-3-methylbut-2-en-1-yl diphosphate synthase IspG/GcpE
MGVNEHVADLYIANGIYTPREQTLLVESLYNMSNTAGRAEYIKLATVTDNIDMAFFRQRQAEMYAAYNTRIQPVTSFVAVGSTSAGMAKNGNIVFTVPLDHLLWTKGISGVIRTATQNVAMMEGVNERHLLISGTASDLARQELQKMGWKVQENADAKLF